MTDTVQIDPKFHLNNSAKKWSIKNYLVGKALSAFRECEIGSIEITLPDGTRFGHMGPIEGPKAGLHFKTARGINKYIFEGEVGFAKAFIDGDVDIPDPLALFKWYLANDSVLSRSTGLDRALKRGRRLFHDLLRSNSLRGSKRNISYHYDLGNEFYREWLDSSMTYSSADYQNGESLEDAQANKYARAIASTKVIEGDNVLEIGCGWGGFADHLISNHDVNYKGVTISAEQLKYAQTRMRDKGLEDELFFFEDYRKIEGQFDKVVSIEMFEAVGEKNWPTYFETVKRLLRPGGKACIQVITIDENFYESYRTSVDFIQTFIFPGGMLPSIDIFSDRAKSSGLKVSNVYKFGKSYAETLREWRTKFLEAWPELELQGFDERFRRMWLYYLEYCEAGFDGGRTDVVQFTLEHA
jgi:cyclopropane-fatty-acyl-phospholipid synthase